MCKMEKEIGLIKNNEQNNHAKRNTMIIKKNSEISLLGGCLASQSDDVYNERIIAGNSKYKKFR